VHNQTVSAHDEKPGAPQVPAGLLPAVFENAGIAVGVLDSDGRFVIANAALCELLGYSRVEVLALTRDAITHSEDLDAEPSLFDELIAGKRPRYSTDKRFLHKSGRVRWGHATVTLLREGGANFAIVVVEDITEKRRIDQASDEVRRAHERYALVARATNDVIWDWDAEQATIVWNDALRAMFGYEPDQIDNRLQWWDSHLHPDDRERVVAGINSIIEQGGSSWTDEYRFERADGTFTEVLDRGYIARSEDGTPIRMIGAMLDVTERKRAERIAAFMAEASAVLASSLDYHATLARVAQLMVPLLADRCFIDLRTGDQTFERLAAVDEDSAAVQMPDRDLIDPIKEVVASGKARLLGDPEARSFGTRSALIVPLTVSEEPSIGALTLAMTRSGRSLAERDLRVVQDVARRAAMAVEHARLYADIQKASLAKDEFLAILSHELSTPLTIILGWSGIISQPDATGEELQRGIEAIRSSAVAQARLIDDVLDLSRVTTGKLHFHQEEVAIGPLVEDSLTAVRVAAAAKRIELTVPDKTTATVLGDANRLRQVIWNLLTNAIKFTEPGGRVSVAIENPPGMIRLTVTDTGRGIDPDFLAHVFEPFRQADASTTRVHGGLGLGLAIVRYLVEAHGGTVAALSDGAGRGTRFVVELPSVQAAAEATLGAPSQSAASAKQESSPDRDAELAGVRVLFVDDQSEARELAHVILSRAGAETILASSAIEAIAVFDRQPVDILVSDIAMPEMDGYALIAEVRRRDALAGRRTPAIAATAYRGSDDRRRALAEGFDAYLPKPMEAETLTSTIAGVLAAALNRR
jgi:PAS domain S-box-containing protein